MRKISLQTMGAFSKALQIRKYLKLTAYARLQLHTSVPRSSYLTSFGFNNFSLPYETIAPSKGFSIKAHK